MRKTLAVTVFSVIAVTMPLSAQQRGAERGAERGPDWLGSVTVAISRMESDVRARASALKRDAFIVAQLVAATAELEDFQKNAAIEKARSRVDAARKRAMENPQAHVSTFELISSINAMLDKAKQQGSMTDLVALRRDILKLLHPLQQRLFLQIDTARRDRQAIADLQTKLINVGTEVDDGMGEAMRTTIDFFRAGGD